MALGGDSGFGGKKRIGKTALIVIIIIIIVALILLAGCIGIVGLVLITSGPEKPTATTTTRATAVNVQKPNLDFDYTYELENLGIIYEASVKVTGTLKNTENAPAESVNIYCHLYDEYNKDIGSGQWMISSSKNLYSNESENFDFGVPTDNPKHITKIECEATCKNCQKVKKSKNF